MACTYEYNGHAFESELALDDFLLENGKLVSKYGDIVFSRTSKANHVYDILMEKSKETSKMTKDYLKDRETWLEDDEAYEVKPPFI